MHHRNRDRYTTPIHDGRYEADYDHGAWDEAWDAPERPRKGIVRRLFSLVKFAVFALPLATFLYGSLADCRSRPASTGWLGVLGAGACARSEMAGSAFSMQDNLAALKRLIN